MLKKNELLCVFLLTCFAFQLLAQDEESDTTRSDLFELIEEDHDVEQEIISIFKSTRLVSGHSIEIVAPGDFLFIIGHRFGELNSGWRNLFGLDNSTIRLGGDFGVTKNLNLGIGRSSFEKTFDGFLKYRLLEQSRGEKNIPLSVGLLTTANVNTSEVPFPNFETVGGKHRWEYVTQLLLAKKVSDQISIQYAPMLIHKNFVEDEHDQNTSFSNSIGTSVKVTPSTSLNVEYVFAPKSNFESLDLRNSLNIGVDIETGGHVFQVHLTNSKGMTEKFLTTETTGDWTDGDIFFGFNVTRSFNLK